MSNLLKLHPEFRVVLPEGATGGTGKLEYQGVYKVAAMLAGASTRIKVIIPDPATPRLGKIVNVTNNGDVLVLGALMGDPLPPYVTLTIYPTLASGKADPVTLEGRPHEHPAGSGFWDLHDIGEDPNGPVVTSREQQINLLSATAAANEAAGKVTAEVTRWNAEQQGVQSWKADLEADIAQRQTQAEVDLLQIKADAYNTLLIERVPTRAGLAGKPDGTYIITGENLQLDYKNGAIVPGSESAVLAPASLLAGVTNQAALGAPTVGVAGIIERPARMMVFSDTQRVERITYGIAENAVVHSLSNLPGARSQITGVYSMPEIAAYHSFDHVTAFAEFSVEPGLYNLPAGNGTFTDTTVVCDSVTHFGALKPGMFVFVEGDPGWYGDVRSWDTATRTITVGSWHNFNPQSGAVETPPNGKFVRLNPLSKAWVDNRNLLFPAGSFKIPGVIAEWGIMNNNEDNADLNGIDLVSLGRKSVGSAVVVRSSFNEGSWAYGLDVSGAREAGVYIHPGQGNIRPKIDVAAVSGTQIGLYSAGGKSWHIKCDSSTAPGVFDVEDNGMVNAAQGYAARGEGGRNPFTAYVGGKIVASISSTGVIAGSTAVFSQGAEISSYLDLHAAGGTTDFGVRLVADEGGEGLAVQGPTGRSYIAAQKYITVANPTTPSGSADSQGPVGAMTWDNNYVYVKTGRGWRRSALTTF